jgi:hypothetical protein
MADNVVLNAGSGGVTALTDDCTTGHAQVVKLAIATDGSATLIPGDATTGLYVNPTDSATRDNGVVDIGAALPAGTNNIGDVDVATVPAPLNVVGGGVEAAALRVTIASDSTGVLSIDDNGGAITVDGTVAVTNAGLTALNGAISGTEVQVDVLTMPTVTVDSELTTADLDTGAGTDTRAVVGLVGSASGGGALIPGSATDGLLVNLGANNDVTVTGTVTANLAAGTNNIGDIDVLSIAAGDNNIGNVDVVTLPNVTLAAGTNTNEVVGDAAHDAAIAGNPVSVGGAAQNNDDTAPPNRVSAEGDIARFATDLDGVQYVRTHGPQVWSYHVNGSSALTDTSVHAAPGAGLSLYITDIIVSSGAATAMNMFLEEGATTVFGPIYLEAVAGRGFCHRFATPKKITANTALTITTSAAIAHSVDITGFTAQG